MAKKKSGPAIGELLGLRWTLQEPEEPESFDNCNFCKGKIRVTEKYFYGEIRGGIEDGMVAYVACLDCAKAAGLEW